MLIPTAVQFRGHHAAEEKTEPGLAPGREGTDLVDHGESIAALPPGPHRAARRGTVVKLAERERREGQRGDANMTTDPDTKNTFVVKL